MLKYDAGRLAESLNGLAEYFDRKPLTPKALEIWFGTLKEFNTELILGLLSTWSKQHLKFPVAAEIWAIANNIGLNDREQRATLERQENQQPVKFERTETGRGLAAALRLAVQHKKRSPREHWHSVLQENQQRFPKGSIGHAYATEALSILQRKRRPDRVPGEDDEDRAV